MARLTRLAKATSTTDSPPPRLVPGVCAEVDVVGISRNQGERNNISESPLRHAVVGLFFVLRSVQINARLSGDAVVLRLRSGMNN